MYKCFAIIIHFIITQFWCNSEIMFPTQNINFFIIACCVDSWLLLCFSKRARVHDLTITSNSIKLELQKHSLPPQQLVWSQAQSRLYEQREPVSDRLAGTGISASSGRSPPQNGCSSRRLDCVMEMLTQDSLMRSQIHTLRFIASDQTVKGKQLYIWFLTLHNIYKIEMYIA